MRTMIGLMAGPERPPNLLPIAGRKLLTSILRPRMVFYTTSASAPAASAALAIARRARDVDLEDVDLGHADVARHGCEILDCRRRDRADQRRREALVVGNLVAQEIFDALGRQADGVDHAAFDLGHARRRVAGEKIA